MNTSIDATVMEGLEVLSYAVCMFGPDRKLVYTNKYGHTALGLDAESGRVGTAYGDVIAHLRNRGVTHPKLDKEFVQTLLQFECEIVSGEILEVRVDPLDNGGLMICARDVTARYESFRAIGTVEHSIRNILDRMTDTFYRTDVGGKIVMASRSIVDLLGYEPSEVMGRQMADLYRDPGEYTAFMSALDETGGGVVGFESGFTHKDGHTVWVSSNARRVNDDDGAPIGVEGVCRNVTEEKNAKDDLIREVEDRTEHLHREITERRHTEEALRESEERYALAMEAAREGIWDLDVASDRMFLSPRVREIVQIDKAWWQSLDFASTYIHPDDARNLHAHMVAHIKGLTPVMECDYRVYVAGVKDHMRWVRNRAVAVRDSEGRAVRVVGAIMDVNDSRAVEQALKQSEQRFRDIAEAASDWFWEWNSKFQFDFISDRFFLISGLDRESVLGRSLMDLQTRGVVSSLGDRDDLDEAVSVHESFRNLEFKLERPDGRILYLQFSGRPFYADDGTFMGYRGVGTDTTRQVEAEERANEAQQKLRLAIETISEAFVVFDSEDRLIAYNSKYPELYADIADIIRPGVSFETIARTGAERGLYANAIGRVDEWVAERLAIFRKPGGPIENEFSNGRWIRISERKMPDGGTVGIRSDITELKHTQQELERAHTSAEQASKAKSNFLANMSHELRTPLNAIMGFSDVMRAKIFGVLGNDKYEEYNEAIHQSGQHLLELIEDVLDVAKIEAGKLEMFEEELDIADVGETCLRLVEGRARRGGVEVINDLDPNVPLLLGDRRRLRQIFLNLLSNAVKFTDPGGTVCLESKLEDSGGLTIVVRDTGIGMSHEELERALEPFGQAEGAHARKYEGTGLGLPLVEGLVDNHGGTLSIISEVGEGTTATVRFPAFRTIKPSCSAVRS